MKILAIKSIPIMSMTAVLVVALLLSGPVVISGQEDLDARVKKFLPPHHWHHATARKLPRYRHRDCCV